MLDPFGSPARSFSGMTVRAGVRAIGQSRKVWASVVALTLLSVLFYLGAISGETYAWGLTVVAGVFTGASQSARSSGSSRRIETIQPAISKLVM